MAATPTEDAAEAVAEENVGVETETDRGQWGSRFGFIMAAVGSAVGLGNIWRFPFTTAANGGAAFVVLYLAMLVLVGLPGMLAELAVGRKARLNAVGSYREAGDQGDKWQYVGLLGVVSAMVVLSYYAVVAGWTVQYLLGSFSGAYFGDPGTYLAGVLEGPAAIAFQLGFMALTAGVIAAGVSNGIERVVKVMIPALIIIAVTLTVYAFTLPGASAGYAFFLQPDFSAYSDPGNFVGIAVDAAGQAAFTLSLGQAAIITYGSYLDPDSDLSSDGLTIAAADTGVAILGGLLVFPLLAAFGNLETAGGPETMFLAIPDGLATLGLGGQILGVFFFLALALAAFSSAISLLEVPTSYLVDEWGVSRWRASILLAEFIALVGLLSSMDQDFLTFMDLLAVNVLILGGLFGLSVYGGWFMPDLEEEVNRGAEGFEFGGFAKTMLRYVTPVILFGLLIVSLQDFVSQLAALM
jgi:NSS family neurotransmitter:Na+ symporter